MLNQFFLLNKNDERGLNVAARDCFYHEIPKYFYWDQEDNQWRPRKRALKTVGRIHFISMHQGERYFMRLILIHKKNIQSWADLREANGTNYQTCREAADALGLLVNDKQYDEALKEGAMFKTGHQLRVMFTIILIFSPPAGPTSLFQLHWHNLGDDVKHILKTKYDITEPEEDQIKAFILYQIRTILDFMGSNLKDVGLMMSHSQIFFLKQLQLSNLDGEEPVDFNQRWKISLSLLNPNQLHFYNMVTSTMQDTESRSKIFYLDGPGGSGKTFLLNCIIDFCRSRGESIVPVASTGVAALLMPGGQTAHSAFKIPVKFSSESNCNFTPRDKIGQNLFKVQVLIWDEAVAMHKHAIETVDRSLQDLMQNNQPFGGKIVFFSGDFRQTLPVVKAGVYPRSEASTLKSSKLWSQIHTFSLKDKICLGLGLGIEQNHANMAFAQELLEIGEGVNQSTDTAKIRTKNIKVNFQQKASRCFNLAMGQTYRDLGRMIHQDWRTYASYLSGRIILTPLNADASKINNKLVHSLKTPGICSTSIDKTDDSGPGPISVEALNKIDFPGFPTHKLELKEGIPVVLLRNLNIKQGLCNGTRIVIEHLSPRALSGRILNGPFRNQEVLIPKITLYHEGDSTVKVPFYRYQFPVSVAFAMTINKCQGQSMDKVSLVLIGQVFAHGQLYLGMSRVKDVKSLFVTQVGTDSNLLNVVVKSVINQGVTNGMEQEDVMILD
jgi:hypothetical protein